MSTSENIQAWSKTAASNDGADAGIGAVADTSSPDTVDNWIRSMMAAVAKHEDDIGGGLVAGGTANALTVTTNQVLTSGQVTDGLRILLKATADNTSTTVTFAPDGLTAANIKRADGSALAVGSIKSGMYLDLVYNSGSSEWRCANIAPININPGSAGMILLASGTVAAAATLDLVLTGYTAYRGLVFVLSGFVPATDGVSLQMQFSTDGGSNYDASGYNYVNTSASDDGNGGNQLSGSAAVIQVTTTNASNLIGNGATEGVNAEINLMKQGSTALWGRVLFRGYLITSAATPAGCYSHGGGARESAQDTDAVRFKFNSGNIASGDYAVYGLA